MNAEQQIKSSYEHLGNSTHSELWPVITKEGLKAGWRYSYPAMLNLNGVNYSVFTTLDALIAEGLIRLERRQVTLV